jgi:hypothetical protein
MYMYMDIYIHIRIHRLSLTSVHLSCLCLCVCVYVCVCVCVCLCVRIDSMYVYIYTTYIDNKYICIRVHTNIYCLFLSFSPSLSHTHTTYENRYIMHTAALLGGRNNARARTDGLYAC